jgi:hypothetical protein
MADMLNLASGIQNYQQAQQINPLALQQKQLELYQAQQMNPLAVRRATAEANVAEQTQGSKISQAQSEAGSAATRLNSDQLKNLQEHVGYAAKNTLDLLNSDEPITYEKVKSVVTDTMKNAGSPQAAIDQALMGIPKDATPTQMKLVVGKFAMKALSTQDQLEKLYPNNQMITTGARAVPTTTGGALAMQAPGQATGPGIQAELPPTTPVVRNGVTGYMGAPPNVQASLTPGQSSFSTGTGTAAAGDVAQTQADATTATRNKAIFQTMKGLIPEAYTGLGSDKKLFAQKVADAIGIPYDTLKTSNTEELMKNQNLLALVGGNTDSARALAQVANPNVTMTKAGLNKVINQLISFEDLKTAKANFLSQYQSDPTTYGQKLLQFNNLADPRFFQQMTQEEAQQMLKSMTPGELQALRQKKALAKQLGIIQ